MASFQLFGHACGFIRMGGVSILTDPHLFDTFGRGIYGFYPPREVHRQHLPKLDAVFLSHHHRDHLHATSLALLDRATPIICPDDAEIRYILRNLGFGDINIISAWDEIRLGDARLCFTPSLYPDAEEYGMMVAAEDGVLWNMVDTVVDDAIVERSRAVLNNRRVDVLTWPYQPLLETQVSTTQSLDFPASAYESKLQTVAAVSPRIVVPYADGQFCVGPAAWINHYRFPVTLAEVTRDVAAILPDTRVEYLTPGAELAFAYGKVSRTQDAQHVSPTAHDEADRMFDATGPVPPVSDSAPSQLLEPLGPLPETVTALESAFSSVIRSIHGRSLVAAAARWGVRYELVLEVPGAEDYCAYFDADRGCLVARGPNDTWTGGIARARMSLGVLQRAMCGDLHFIDAYLGGLIRSCEIAFTVGRGGVQTARVVEATQVGSGNEILSASGLLNLLVAANPAIRETIMKAELARAERGQP